MFKKYIFCIVPVSVAAASWCQGMPAYFSQTHQERLMGVRRQLILTIMLVPTTGGDNYHTTRGNYIKYDKNKHLSLPK